MGPVGHWPPSISLSYYPESFHVSLSDKFYVAVQIRNFFGYFRFFCLTLFSSLGPRSLFTNRIKSDISLFILPLPTFRVCRLPWFSVLHSPFTATSLQIFFCLCSQGEKAIEDIKTRVLALTGRFNLTANANQVQRERLTMFSPTCELLHGLR